MLYYQEATLLPDEETPYSFLWTKVFTQLHIGFADWINHKGTQPFAVAFPDYTRKKLGGRIRVIAPAKEDLEGFEAARRLERLTDYVRLSPVRPVPEDQISGWAVYARWHEEKVMPCRIRRYVKRHPETTYDEAAAVLTRRNPKGIPPFIWMKSLTNRSRFCLFIEKKPVEAETAGPIGSYGLSDTRSVPDF